MKMIQSSHILFILPPFFSIQKVQRHVPFIYNNWLLILIFKSFQNNTVLLDIGVNFIFLEPTIPETFYFKRILVSFDFFMI